MILRNVLLPGQPLKRLPGCLAGLAWALGVHAQVGTGYDPAFDAAERTRIIGERARAVERFDGEEADCYQRFAVNDCLIGVRRRKRVVMDELRRQEVLLNDQKRAAAAIAEQRRLEERQAEREGPDSQAQREQSRQSYDERQTRAQERQAEAGSRRGDDTTAAPRASSSAASADATREAAARRADNLRAYEEKQQSAREHREAHDREAAQGGQPVVKPLPVQP